VEKQKTVLAKVVIAGKTTFSTSWQKITVSVIFQTENQVWNIVLECNCC